ncbi:Cytosolic iron-sulfur protein assembly protein [Puccinia graminis f. sp. tritici]|uniref:Cytosolic iron-sulfur protein assembly protein n=1 Tax=Puccinia graminis f. sp. tritici TaxID=56615 RepID=A0A5B0LVU7_PUCGR|nr:Cytosolic iron-sulfur protein assembly protein [Puccinia graminis f. sp. tritici]
MSQPTSPSNPASTHTEAQDEGKQTTIELVQVLQGHSDRAWSVAWHLTRPILASSSTDKQLRLYQYHLRPNPLDATTPELEFQYIDSIPSAHTRTRRFGPITISIEDSIKPMLWTRKTNQEELDRPSLMASKRAKRAGSV